MSTNDNVELKRYYDIEYSAVASGAGDQRVYLKDIGFDDFSPEALEAAKEEVETNPDIDGDLFGEWEMSDDTIEIQEYVEGDNSWKCCLCDAEFIGGFGNNPDPLMKRWNAQCCNACNTNLVIPARLKQVMEANSRK